MMINIINQNQEIVITLGVVLVVFFFWNIYLSVGLLKIKKRTRSFFASNEAKDLEEIIYKQIKKTNEVDAGIEKIIEENKKINQEIKKCVQNIGFVRFNPFGDVGGNQSFAIAFLDRHLNGVTILSLYSRDGVKVYAKQIVEGKSEQALSEEEKEAMIMSVKNNKKII